MLESNQRVINDVAERNLKVDAGDRFELPMHLAYETGVVTTLPAIFVATLLVLLYTVCHGEFFFCIYGPSGGIRTHDPLLPKQMR